MWIRTSTEFYFRFILDMDRSPGFGSAGPPRNFTSASAWTWVDHPVSGLHMLTSAPLRLGFPSAPHLLVLNLASIRNSPDRSTKSTRSRLDALPQFVNTGFQVLFHSPPGVLFTFPSQYSALSVTKEYSALGGGPPDFPQGFTCPAVLWILPLRSHFHIRGGTLDPAAALTLSHTGLSPSPAGLPRPFC